YAPPASLKIGTMIEVPSLMWQLDQLLPETDFVSVGSNDLVQFLFAADRGHPRLAQRYDTLSPPVLNVLRDIALKTTRHEVPLTLCGEMAGRPLEAMALMGVGLTSISMNPASIGPVKAMLLALDVGKLEAFLLPRLASGARSLREDLQAFAAENGIPV
ncbi:MAG: peptidase, partial [Aestuariivirgaceae bacterium]|nr:peptidase [Aestuariivirgaceae bacterium]